MLEIERQDGHVMELGVSHDRGIYHSEAEIGEPPIDCDRPTQQIAGWKHNRVFPLGHGGEELASRERSEAGAEQLVHLDQDWARHDQIAAQLGNERRRQLVRALTTIRSRDKRTRVRYDLHSLVASSPRYRSARRPRSSGPSPLAT